MWIGRDIRSANFTYQISRFPSKLSASATALIYHVVVIRLQTLWPVFVAQLFLLLSVCLSSARYFTGTRKKQTRLLHYSCSSYTFRSENQNYPSNRWTATLWGLAFSELLSLCPTTTKLQYQFRSSIRVKLNASGAWNRNRTRQEQKPANSSISLCPFETFLLCYTDQDCVMEEMISWTASYCGVQLLGR